MTVGRRVSRASRSRFVGEYGAAFADVVEALPTNQWSGPVESSRGVHLVRLTDDLLTNVYRSFDFRDEEVVYDRLAVSVVGPQLADVYLENRRALELENRGGARASVDEVEILEVGSPRRDGAGGFRVNATWSVSGSVNHFGHVHYRQNRYEAELHLQVVDGVWKLRQIELLDERRVL
jgi:hypothetical protein